ALLRNRDPALREVAVRRLLPRPELAAREVAGEFATGPLQARLAALELLREWQAPVADLDPWRPETLTEPPLKAVRGWAANANPRAEAGPKPLTPEQLAAARQDLDRLPAAPEAEALAVRERLARFGPALLPEVYARLKQPPTDQARERLTALRYRLV